MRRAAIAKELARLDRSLMDKGIRAPARMDSKWAASAPKGPGVYAWFDKDRVIYVGESGSICARCGDARRTKNHSLRRAIGRAKYSRVEGYVPADTKTNFPPHIEKRLNGYMKKLSIAWLEIDFGRTEFEEYLIKQHRPVYNTRARRGGGWPSNRSLERTREG